MKLLLSCAFLCSAIAAFAQEPCGTMFVHQTALSNPEYAAKHALFEKNILQRTQEGLPEAAAVITLPVVVHVVHNNGAENIPDALVYQAIQQLNEAFANTGYYDQGTGANTMIQFCLAQRTPGNQPTTGITRTVSALTDLDMGSEDDDLKNLIRWDPLHHINVWVVKEICSPASCSVAGYATLPVSHGGDSDGIVLEADYMGSSPANTGVLVHEMGHYLGLYHTFEGGCTNSNCLTTGDRVCDTPPDQSTAWVPCNAAPNTCSTDTQSGFATDQPDMISNYMDYTDFACFNDFTPGQADRMNLAIQTERATLLESAACLSPCPNPQTAQFTVPQTVLDVGGSLTFTNTSLNASGYQWLVNGVPFSTAVSPTYTFTNEGFYTIVLLASGTPADLCLPDSFGLNVEVRCPVVADFTASAQTIHPGETVTFTDNSLNATQTAWFVEGVPQGATLTSFTFNDAGAYAVRLTVSNGNCSSTKVRYISVVDTCFAPTFQITLGDGEENRATKAVYLTDGNLLVGGITRSINGTTDVAFVKLTPNGQPIWTKFWGLPNSNEVLTALVAMPDGEFAAAMTTNLYSGNADPIIGRFNNLGSHLWQKRLQTGSDDNFQSITPTADGGMLVVGAIRPNPWWDAYLLRLSSNGTPLWAKQYQGGNTDVFTNIKPVPGGGYIVTGYTLSFGQNTATIHDGMLARLDDQGSVLWTKAYGRSGNEGFGNVFLTSDGGYITMGGSGSFNGNGNDVYFDDTWVVKTDASGNLQWAKAYRTNLNIDCSAYGVVEGVDGGYVIAANDQGTLGSFDTYYFKIGDNGDLEWSRVYGGSGVERVIDVAALPDGYLLPGTTNSVGAGNFDFYVVKTDLAGYADDCFEVPHTVTVENIQPLVENGSFDELEPPPLLEGFLPIADAPTPFTLNAYCTYNCLQENCSNGIDDDGDGLVDCIDSDCDCNTCDPSNTNIWYFGNQSGLDFGQNPPAVLTNGQSVSFEASAVASDAFGNLLFYTNGTTLYNRNHTPMPNGGGLNGQSSTSQCIIVPHPGNPALYYVFTSASYDTPPVSGTHYSVVDMSLNGGLGDVVAGQKNITLVPASDFDEKITAVRHCNGTDYWVVSHSGVSNRYYAWRVTEAGGLNTTPVVSGVGIPSVAPNGTTNVIGQMKLSPDGRRIARALFQFPGVEVADFDPQTGVVSNARLLQKTGSSRYYGVEFSPDGQLLYATALTAPSELLQFDLSTDSVVVLATFPQQYRYGQLQLAPNGKLYVTNSGALQYANKLGVIHQPNAQGAACTYIENGLSLAPTAGANLGLPGFVTSFFWKPYVAFRENDGADTVCGLPQTHTYRLRELSCAVDTVVWQVQGPATVLAQTRDSITVQFTQAGNVTVTVRALAACGEASDTISLVVTDPPLPPLDLGPDIAVCDNGAVTLDAGPDFVRYRWSNNSTEQSITTTEPGWWVVETWDACDRRQVDSVFVSIIPNTVLNAGADANICVGQTKTYTLPAPFTGWTWYPATNLDCAACPTVTLTAPADTVAYIVLAYTPENCVSVDTVWVYPAVDEVQLTVNTTLCAGDTLTLFGASITGDTTLQLLLNNSGSCDTLLTLNATAWPSYAQTTTLLVCPGETASFGNQALPEGGPYSFPFVSANGCDSTWTVFVEAFDTTAELVQLFACPGETASWNGLALPADSTYSFVFSDQNGCDSVVTVQVASRPGPVVVLPADTLLPLGETLVLPAIASGATPLTYDWQPPDALSCTDCPAPEARPFTDTWFSVTVTDPAGCQASDSMLVRIDPDCAVYVPNAFLPDDDGRNDFFYPGAGVCVRAVRVLRVYDRWGELVFERRDFQPNVESLGWDGRFNGKLLTPGVFVWTMELEFLDGRTKSYQGDVTLIK